MNTTVLNTEIAPFFPAEAKTSLRDDKILCNGQGVGFFVPIEEYLSQNPNLLDVLLQAAVVFDYDVPDDKRRLVRSDLMAAIKNLLDSKKQPLILETASPVSKNPVTTSPFMRGLFGTFGRRVYELIPGILKRHKPPKNNQISDPSNGAMVEM